MENPAAKEASDNPAEADFPRLEEGKAMNVPVPPHVLEVLISGRLAKRAGEFTLEEQQAILKGEIPQASKDLDHLLDGWEPEFNKGE